MDEVVQAADFCSEHVEFSTLPTAPILALIRVKDDTVRDIAILSVKNCPKKQNSDGENKKGKV